jgi:hypothetical protein
MVLFASILEQPMIKLTFEESNQLLENNSIYSTLLLNTTDLGGGGNDIDALRH